MVQYSVELKLKDNPDSKESYRYTLDLTIAQENNPNLIFTSEIRQRMRQSLQKQSSCKINEANLNQIIKTWSEDIREGYRLTIITLDLPLLVESNLDQLIENGNLEIPALVEPEIAEIEPQSGALPPLIFAG
ncbi:MAG: hypothetical protein ACOC0N_11825 [Chroococcales cyanobacterium]